MGLWAVWDYHSSAVYWAFTGLAWSGLAIYQSTKRKRKQNILLIASALAVVVNVAVLILRFTLLKPS